MGPSLGGEYQRPVSLRQGSFLEDERTAERKDNQHLVLNALLGHAELFALRRIQSSANRDDALVGARSRRVWDLRECNRSRLGRARGPNRAQSADGTAAQSSFDQTIADTGGFTRHIDFSCIIGQ